MKQKRGFALMAPERQREIATKGGANVPRAKRGFAKSSELARRAGSKGGRSVKPANRAFSRNKELAREAGRKGGLNSQKKKKTRAAMSQVNAMAP